MKERGLVVATKQFEWWRNNLKFMAHLEDVYIPACHSLEPGVPAARRKYWSISPCF